MYLPDLHAELIRGLGRHVDPAGDRRFVEALRVRSVEVRLAAVEPWTQRECGPLPVEAINRRSDPDPRVRAAVIDALTRQRHPKAFEYLSAALDDHELRVRTAAIAALGRLGGSLAESALVDKLRDDAERIREAAVSALTELGAEEPVLRAAADKSWRVRAAVARALARFAGPDAVETAGKLVTDSSSTVRSDLIESIARWPLPAAGPILLEAMAGRAYQTRHAAASQLAGRWPAAGEFPTDGPDGRRAEALHELRRRFEAQFGAAESRVALNTRTRDPAVQLAAALEPAEPWPSAGADIEVLLGRLASEDVSVRREAAARLAKLSGGRPLGKSACSRLASLVVAEPDPLVWRSVLTAVRGDGSEPAIRLAYAAIGHPSPEVRRLACEHLAAHADPEHAAVLLPALEDPTESVRSAAVAALAAGGTLEDPEPLERLLTSSSGSLRVEAAAALCRLKDPSGPAALERLTFNDDPTVRRLAAAAMGQIGDPSFAGSLIRLLDDRPSVRTAALESLPKVVGRNAAGPSLDSAPDDARRIEIWKAWYGHAGKV